LDDLGAKALGFSATVKEEVVVGLSRQYLDDHKASGLNIRIIGRRRALVVTVSGPYVTGFLNKFDQQHLKLETRSLTRKQTQLQANPQERL